MTDEIKEAIEAMEANEPQANLYRAAEEYVADQAYELMGIGDDDDFNKLAELMKQAVLYGAHWKEQQMMKKAINTEVYPFNGSATVKWNCVIPWSYGIKLGDKVKLIIIKEDKV